MGGLYDAVQYSAAKNLVSNLNARLADREPIDARERNPSLNDILDRFLERGTSGLIPKRSQTYALTKGGPTRFSTDGTPHFSTNLGTLTIVEYEGSLNDRQSPSIEVQVTFRIDKPINLSELTIPRLRAKFIIKQDRYITAEYEPRGIFATSRDLDYVTDSNDGNDHEEENPAQRIETQMGECGRFARMLPKEWIAHPAGAKTPSETSPAHWPLQTP